MKYAPELLRFADGRKIDSVEAWERRRAECLGILSHEIYGVLPPPPVTVTGCVQQVEHKCCAGHAVLETIMMTAETGKGSFSFPIRLFLPTRAGRYPVFVLLNFRPDVYDMYYPAEEIVDNGFALAVLHYEDVTRDDADMTDGLGALMEREAGCGTGKIGMWAWAASRVLDYLLTRPEIDGGRAAVIGHSRLGKTALWCGANDTRFRYVFANDSGCGGAALEKTKHPGGETVEDITRQFGYWFCDNYRKYIGRPETMPFDQHFLLAAIAPRCVEIGSAAGDPWADPYSEQLGCMAASPAWQMYDLPGYIGPQTPASAGEHHAEGCVGYHLRDGIHFLSRQDWLCYMDFMKRH